MVFEDRKQLIGQLNEMEAAYPVAGWQVAEIDLWPVLKKDLFFYTFNGGPEKSTGLPHRSLKRRLLALLKVKLRAWLYLFTLRLSPADFVFAGAPSHRVPWAGKAFNRYFDPMITHLRSKQVRSYLTEYEYIDEKLVEHPEHFINVGLLLAVFQRKTDIKGPWKQLEAESGFQAFRAELQQRFPIYAPLLEKRMQQQLQAISNWARLYTHLFRKIKPRYAVALCYYSTAVFGMNVAARARGIRSVDMQHGGQGLLHPAYNYLKVPARGYNTLPDLFWCWDELSCRHINSWAAPNVHRAQHVGNPWYTCIKDSGKAFDGSFDDSRKLILFSHQPLAPLLDPYLLDCIRATRAEYQWWIRLHPRISAADKKALRYLLEEAGLAQEVEIEAATRLPLPVVLNHTAVHLSKYSGTILESIMAGVPTIILERIGQESFAPLIEDERALGLLDPTAESLRTCLEELLSRPRKQRPSPDFKPFLNNLIRTDKPKAYST